VTIVYELALRYAVLCDVSFGRAVAQGWNTLWVNGARSFLLVMILPQLAYSIVLFTVVGLFMLPALIAFSVTQSAWLAVLFFVPGFFVCLVLASIYSTFYSASWTVFFRRMIGLEPASESAPAVVPGVYPPTQLR